MVTGCTRGYPSKSGNAPTRSVPGIGEEEFPDGTYPRALTVPWHPPTPPAPDGHMGRLPEASQKEKGAGQTPFPRRRSRVTFPAFRSTPARLPDEWTAATPSFCPGGHSLLWLVRPPERDCYYPSVFGCVKSPDAPGLILMAGGIILPHAQHCTIPPMDS